MTFRAFAILALAAGAAHAQGLRIRVVDESGEPVRLALVTLLRGEREQGSGLTRGDGTRFFPADPAGRYVARVARPGLEPVTSGTFAVPGDTAAVTIVASATPMHLRERATARECRADRLPAATARLRDQAILALRLAELARDEGIETIAIRRLERTYDRDLAQRDETIVAGGTLGARLFRTESNERLARLGFARTDSTSGLPVFLGPDLSWFTSAEFIGQQCLAVVEGSGSTAGMLGLEFTPRTTATAQPAGVMWFDTQPALLRMVEFQLTGGGVAPGSSAGRVALEQLPSGVWIARDWSLRTPVTTQAGQLLGFREDAGEALQVSATMLAVADSIANSRRPPGRVNGVVMDSLLGRPLAGAVVRVEPAGPSARSDSSGTFAIRSVPAGFHRLTVAHPLLDSIGTRPHPRLVRVGADSTSHVVLGGPSLATLKGGACADSLAVLTGLVREVGSGTPVELAQVSLSWIELVFQPDRPLVVNPMEIVVETDSTGRYAACVPARLEITAFAESGGSRTGRVDVRPEHRRLAVQYLALDPTATDTLVGAAVVHGVVMYQDRTPLPNATVLLTDPERTVVTDSAGRFRFASIPGGTRVLDVRALGHAPARVIVEARTGDTTTAQMFMRRVTQLDAVVVRASAGAGSRALLELEERRRRGVGYRLTPLELLSFRHARMDAVARALPLTEVRWAQGTARVLVPAGNGRLCTPLLYVDGTRSDPDLLGEFPASEVLAVEFFARASEVPVRYRTASDCGAILLWTREGAQPDR